MTRRRTPRRTTRPSARRLLSCLCLLVLASALQAETSLAEISLRFVSPTTGPTVFQHFDVEVSVQGDVVPQRVEIWLDGRLVGTVKRPPFRLNVDFGDANVGHLLEARAFGAHGELARRRIQLTPWVVDDVVGVQLQQVYVTVTDRRGRRVLDLAAQDFTLRDDGRKQELVTFGSGEIPFTALLLVDGSQSMAGSPLASAAAGVRRFAGEMARHDEASVLLASDRLLLHSPWSTDGNVLAEALLKVDAVGGSALFDHLYLALGLVEARQGRRVVIVLSDGLDLHSALEPTAVGRIARQSQAQVYWIRLGDGSRERVLKVDSASLAAGSSSGVYFRPAPRVPLSSWRTPDETEGLAKALEVLVKESGGRVVWVASEDAIAGALSEILAELREQYALGYTPDPRRDDGSWRRLKIDLARRGLQVRTRQGYVDR